MGNKFGRFTAKAPAAFKKGFGQVRKDLVISALENFFLKLSVTGLYEVTQALHAHPLDQPGLMPVNKSNKIQASK